MAKTRVEVRDEYEVRDAELAQMERLYYDIQVPEATRLELFWNQLVVTPAPAFGHSTALSYLSRALADVAARSDWVLQENRTVHIPATRERLIPDLLVAPKDAPRLNNGELLSPGVLLAVEVHTMTSNDRDMLAKRRAYSEGGIPLYLIIKPYTSHRWVRVLSDPRAYDYDCQDVLAGEPLRLPAPFDLDLDTEQLLAD